MWSGSKRFTIDAPEPKPKLGSVWWKGNWFDRHKRKVASLPLKLCRIFLTVRISRVEMTTITLQGIHFNKKILNSIG